MSSPADTFVASPAGAGAALDRFLRKRSLGAPARLPGRQLALRDAARDVLLGRQDPDV
jgi:hypothetical protein